MEEEEERAASVAHKRKAWAKSRDSWQASEAEQEPGGGGGRGGGGGGGKLPLATEGGNIPNEKIAIWLKDCRTPLGASLDEQSNLTLKGMLMKNGGSFEDDLSLGAEANQLHQNSEQMEICNGMLAKDKRLQFHQKGRSMNSTGSGKSSTTVSSVSELLELYEEDPEEILYNLGFGRDEPDIASKIPPRFFNSSSFARGIDIKVFLNAQLQRMEVENPNFALTSRFRQIEVLTTVANAFSSLYSQVSGTPMQKIGSMNSTASNKEASSPPPLKRHNTASRLMKTISRLNLTGNSQAGEDGSPTTLSPVALQETENGSEESEVKNDPKTPKHFKTSLLATVKEEVPSNQPGPEGAQSPSELFVNTNVKQETRDNTAPHEDKQEDDSLGHSGKNAVMNSSGLESVVMESTSCEPEENRKVHIPSSEMDKEPCAPITNPSIINLMLQQKDSFEMEEIQSTEGEIPHTPNTGQLALIKTKKDQLLRSASQHSDSSGFAEDSSTDCFLLNQLQGHESLQAMGSSADSCDSETTVTSYSEELKTPIAEQEPYFNELDEEKFLLEVEQQKREIVSKVNAEEVQKILEYSTQSGGIAEFGSEEFSQRKEESSVWEAEADILEEDSEESDVDQNSEQEFLPYKTHHILKPMSSFESSSSSPSSTERITVALQRAQRRIGGSSDSRAGRSLLKSKDLLFKQRHRIAELGYPLRRSQSLPTTLLSPVRVVSSVNVQLAPGKQTLCGPPSFTYKYDTPEESENKNKEDEEEKPIGETNSSPSRCTSTLFIAPSSHRRDPSHPAANKVAEEPCRSRIQSCPLHLPTCMTQSSCSLHSLHSDYLERPLCAHMRTLSTHSIPSTPGSSCSGLPSPFGCPHSLRHFGHPHQFPSMNPVSTVEMQLRRVLHDIRGSLQNLSQNAVMRSHDVTATSYSTQRSSILPLYENTFQDLQVVRRNLNLFRTQMMDLELAMLRQQTTVYQHMTEEERYEADQLQSLRKSVRMELQELEMQLEERLLSLEDQLRSMHVSSPFRQQTLMAMYGGRSTENLSCPSPVNVMEPVSELIREQSYLKSELGMGLGEPGMEASPEATFDHGGHSDTSSVCSSQASRKAAAHSSEMKPKLHGKRVYRACVALMPSPPARAGTGQPPEGSEKQPEPTSEVEQKLEKALGIEEIQRSVENDELQQVIREIKESIVGEIRREIVSGLLAAVSSPNKSTNTN